MKITKRQLKNIICEARKESFSPMPSRAHPSIRAIVRKQRGEEKRRLHEDWERETGSMLLDFAQAWASLGSAVQEQVVAVTAAWSDGAHEPDWSETVYEQNPNAIDMAVQRLGPFLRDLGEDGEFLWDALEEAQKIYRQGDAEVAADKAAAEGY